MTTHFIIRRGAAGLAAFALALSALHAQSTKAELFGAVHDPNKLAISGAKVELKNTGTEVSTTTETDTTGAWHFFALPAGTYSLSISKDSFSTLNREGIVLRVGDQISLDLSLQVGNVSQ